MLVTKTVQGRALLFYCILPLLHISCCLRYTYAMKVCNPTAKSHLALGRECVDYHTFKSQQSMDYDYIRAYKVVHPRTGHGGPQGSRGITLLFNLGDRYSGKSMPRPCSALLLGNRPSIHHIGGQVGRMAGHSGCGKFRPRRNSIPGPSSP